MPSPLSPSFDQTVQLLETLVKDSGDAPEKALVDTATVVSDLGDESQTFEPAHYIGLVVKRALDNK